MKNIFLFYSVPFSFSCRYKSGSGNLVKQTREVSSFSGLSVSGDFDVTLTQGNTSRVEVESDDNLMDEIKTKVNNGTLEIYFDKVTKLRNGTFNIYITVPELNKIDASATANIKANGIFKTGDEFIIKSSSAGEIKINADAPSIKLQSSSAGQISISGRTRNLTVNASSGAEIRAKNLLSETADASASSGADVDVYASISLNASASSGGSIHYSGKPHVNKRESSGGSVNG